MSGGKSERRLAAILVADVVGYSRLMEADEAGTLQALKDRRKGVVEPAVREHSGRIVKFMGDGVLAEFASAVNAANCALAIQQRMAEANEGVPDPRRILLRIGLNLGDVIGEGSDIYGDGVNLAARLEALAEPGGIAMSGTVHEHLGNRVDAAFGDGGEQQVKNIARPIRVWRWPAGAAPTRAAAAKAPAAPALPERPSIAVLPFTNMSGDPEQEYFSDGITEDIITELARFNSLFVIARNSAFHYKGTSPKIQDVGRELGVQYVVEGSVRRAGKRVRVTAQLIEAASGNHLWAERYDRDLEDIFEVQDEVVREIVTAIPGKIDVAALQRVQRRPADNLTAYEFLLRAWQVRIREWGSHEAKDLFEKVIAADPQCALAYAHLANWHAYSAMAHGVPRHEAEGRMRTYADKALQLEANDATILSLVADGYVASGNLDLAKTCIEKAIRLSPNSYSVMSFATVVFAAAGNIEAALRWNDLFRRHDPISIDAHREVMLETYYLAGRFEDAGNALRGWQSPPRHVLAEAAAAFAQAGNLAEAGRLREEFLALSPSRDAFAHHLATQLRIYARQEHRDLWVEGYRKAGFDC